MGALDDMGELTTGSRRVLFTAGKRKPSGELPAFSKGKDNTPPPIGFEKRCWGNLLAGGVRSELPYEDRQYLSLCARTIETRGHPKGISLYSNTNMKSGVLERVKNHAD